MKLVIGSKYLYRDYDGTLTETTVLGFDRDGEVVWHRASYCFADGSSYSTDSKDYFEEIKEKQNEEN